MNSEDLQYIGLKRVWHEEANTPKFVGKINDTPFTILIKGRGKIDVKRGQDEWESHSGVTKDELIKITGFIEPYLETLNLEDT